jgi:dihydrofolate reductase
MRRIVVTEFISLDGVIEDPGGSEGTKHGGWSFKFQDPEGFAFKLEELKSHDAQLLGRTTYEGFAEAWPDRTDELGFAEKMNAMPKYVVSSTLENPTWNNTTVISIDDVAGLKEQEGGDILLAGSASLVQGLMARGLIDEFRLMTFPVVLGSGKRLFGELDDLAALKLADSKVLDSGTLILTYVRA